MMSCSSSDPEMLGEPTLDEMLAEPIIRLIMQRDGVNETDMRGEMARMQQAYASFESVQ